MTRPSSTTIAEAYDNVAAYQRAMALLARARAEVESEPEHIAEHECGGGHPLDSIADAEGYLQTRIIELRAWINVHEEVEA